MLRKGVTIKELAKELNVSIATVSRALRSHPDVNKETRKAVLEMAEKLGYHPNLLASGLSRRKSNIIGVLVPTINRQFWSNSISGIEDVANEMGYTVMICQSGESLVKEKKNIDILANSMVDGMLIALSKETNTYDHLNHVIERGIPLLMFERVHEDIQCSSILTDDFNGAMQAVGHLVSVGCKRIAHITGSSYLDVCRERKRGYEAALQKHGFDIDPALITTCEFTIEAGRDALKKLMKNPSPPDGVFCFADILAVGAVSGAGDLGIDIPNDLAIMGFGNDDITRYMKPSISTMSQPSYDIGSSAARKLIEIIEMDEDEGEPEIGKTVFKPSLILRESTARV
jgi:DNA-binding LacI/PurR family transcriptional regulator